MNDLIEYKPNQFLSDYQDLKKIKSVILYLLKGMDKSIDADTLGLTMYIIDLISVQQLQKRAFKTDYIKIDDPDCPIYSKKVSKAMCELLKEGKIVAEPRDGKEYLSLPTNQTNASAST